jgi:hypothetical protein
METAIQSIDQVYVVGVSFVPGILPGEIYHWNALLAAANSNQLQTLSSTKNFFIYSGDGKQKLLAATSAKENN